MVESLSAREVHRQMGFIGWIRLGLAARTVLARAVASDGSNSVRRVAERTLNSLLVQRPRREAPQPEEESATTENGLTIADFQRHLDRRARLSRKLIISGWVTCGLSYLTSAIFGIVMMDATELGFMGLFPILGPAMMASIPDASEEMGFMWILALVAQGGGFVAALVGHGIQRRDAGAPSMDERREDRRREREERRRRERRASITVTPAGPGGAGVTVSGTFM